MKCPLHGERTSIYDEKDVWQGSKFEFVDCVEGNCAWWDRETQSCAVKAIASILYFRWIRDYNLKEKS